MQEPVNEEILYAALMYECSKVGTLTSLERKARPSGRGCKRFLLTPQYYSNTTVSPSSSSYEAVWSNYTGRLRW